MTPRRRRSDPTPGGTNFGVINSGDITGNVQAAAFSQNVSQTNHLPPAERAAALDRARASISELRQALHDLHVEEGDAAAIRRILDEIAPRIEEPEREGGALRIMLDTLMRHCGGVPGLLAAAQLVQSTVTTLLPASN